LKSLKIFALRAALRAASGIKLASFGQVGNSLHRDSHCVKYSMTITNLKELVAAISDPTLTTTVVARGIDTGSLRLNRLAQTLTNINTAPLPSSAESLVTAQRLSNQD